MGASPEILDDLLSLTHRPETFVARVSAPLEVCLRRIASREPAAAGERERQRRIMRTAGLPVAMALVLKWKVF